MNLCRSVGALLLHVCQRLNGILGRSIVIEACIVQGEWPAHREDRSSRLHSASVEYGGKHMTAHNDPMLGIDVSKEQLDVCVLQATDKRLRLTVKNSPAGYQKLKHWLEQQKVEPAAAGLEATNVYSTGIAMFLYEQNMVVYLSNPSQVHA